MDLFTRSGADFSDCKRYRYTLWRQWSESIKPCMFLMLNPSTADAFANDPTVERCERRARVMGYGGLIVCNLFGLRSTDPNGLYVKGIDPVGPDNDQHIVAQAARVTMIVCAWGTHGRHLNRQDAVVDLLTPFTEALYALRINQDGTPQHPLYLGYDSMPVQWRPTKGSK